MATRTRQGFEDLGREHAKNGDVRRYKGTDTSWQARAYSTGWDLGKGDLETAAKIRPLGKSVMPQVVKSMFPKPINVRKDDKVVIWFDELVDNRKPDGIRLDRMEANTKGWPHGAAHHALLLAKSINEERSVTRRARLLRSLGRLQQRHGASK